MFSYKCFLSCIIVGVTYDMFLSSAVWYQLDFLVALTTGLYLTSGFTPRYLPRVVDPLDLPKNVVSKLHFPSVQHTNDLRKDVKRRLRRGIILLRRRSTCRVPGGKSNSYSRCAPEISVGTKHSYRYVTEVKIILKSAGVLPRTMSPARCM